MLYQRCGSTGLDAAWILHLSALPPDSGTHISKRNGERLLCIRKQNWAGVCVCVPSQSSLLKLPQVPRALSHTDRLSAAA